jgi:hypothetical protein
MTLRSLLATAAALACGACGRGEPLSKASMEHGIHPGEQMVAASLSCMTGGERTLADPSAVQVVTFATPYDCSACSPHMALVPRVLRRVNASDRAFVVVWAPNRASLAHSLGRARSELPVCLDEKGVYWDRHNIQHTPFTVVIDHGRVVYTNDATLQNRATVERFTRDLNTVFANSTHHAQPLVSARQ